MRKLLLLLAACSIWACSDSRNKDIHDAGSEDAGGHDHQHDADDGGEADADVDGDAGTPSALGERPPGSLERPPGEKLPDDLKPPGFTR